MNEQLTRVEELLAHQQRLLEQLNGVVTEQRREIDLLLASQARLEHTVKRLAQFQEGAEGLPDEKPPHY